MFRNVLWAIVALAGLALAGCGEDSSPPGGGGNGSPEEGEGSAEGEGEEPIPGEGEGEGAGTLPPGGDLEPCGTGPVKCQDGLECIQCGSLPRNDGVCDNPSLDDEGHVCTCPQWFEGTWWAEYEPRAVDYEYDFTRGTGNQERWAAHEVTIKQNGCAINLPESRSMLGGRVREGNKVDPPPLGFWFKRRLATEDGREGFVIFSGHLSEDHRLINGECDGEYDDYSVSPAVFFHVTCTFSLTLR